MQSASCPLDDLRVGWVDDHETSSSESVESDVRETFAPFVPIGGEHVIFEFGVELGVEEPIRDHVPCGLFRHADHQPGAATQDI